MIKIPSLYWRDMVRESFFGDPGDDELFRNLLDVHFPDSRGHERFVLAVALLTFGILDVVDDILDNVPPVGHPARILARSIDNLLPPGAGDSLADPTAVRNWLDNNRERVQWNDERGVFELTSSGDRLD